MNTSSVQMSAYFEDILDGLLCRGRSFESALQKARPSREHGLELASTTRAAGEVAGTHATNDEQHLSLLQQIQHGMAGPPNGSPGTDTSSRGPNALAIQFKFRCIHHRRAYPLRTSRAHLVKQSLIAASCPDQSCLVP